MPQPAQSRNARARFDVFEVNVCSGELRRDGKLVALQEKPLQLLLALVENSGVLVTREELRNRLWPSDTYGSFDDGLNTAIRKLRQALNDSAEAPRFIETIPKRGYRFVATVEFIDIPAPSAVVVPIGKRAVTREISLNSVFSPLRQLAMSQTFFFLLAVLELLDLGKGMGWAPHLLNHMLYKWVYLCNAVVVVAGFLFTGLSALEIWRGSLEGVRSFRRLFALYVLFDIFLIQVVLYLLYRFDVLGYALVLLPVLVYLPFYQKRLALRILAAPPIESIRDAAKSR